MNHLGLELESEESVDFSNLVNSVRQILGDHLPNLIGGLVVFVIGWIIASLAARFFKRAIHRINVNKHVSEIIYGPRATTKTYIKVETWLTRSVFTILMLFVVLASFQVLGMAQTVQPINAFLTVIFEYAPRIIAPIVLIFIAWIVATVVRTIILRTNEKLKIEERLRLKKVVKNKEEWESVQVSSAFAQTAYWLVFLLFLPAILDSLALKSLMDPLQAMIEKILLFLPDIFAGFLIVLTGWFGAKILQAVVENLFESIGGNKFSEKHGINQVTGKYRLSEILGMILYILIMIPVIVAALNVLGIEAITAPASQMLETLLKAIPSVLGVALLVFVSIIVGQIAAKFASQFLSGIGFNKVIFYFGLTEEKAIAQKTPSDLVGVAIFLAILLFALIESLEMLGLVQIAKMMTGFTFFLGDLLVGLIIFLIGLYFSKTVGKSIEKTSAVQKNLLAGAARLAIVFVAITMALEHIGLGKDIVNLAFGLILGGIAVAVAIAFGFGGREVAAQIVNDLSKKWKSK